MAQTIEELTDIWAPSRRTKRKLLVDMPAVIFTDARHVTRNHARYNMIGKNSVPYHLSQCAYALIKELNVDCRMYTATDEISFLFPSPGILINALETEADSDWVLTLFMEMLKEKVDSVFPELYIKGCIFNVRQENTSAYFEERKKLCHEVAAAYYAKEFLEKEQYVGLAYEQLVALLRAEGLYQSLIANKQLYEGINRIYKNQNNFDYMMEMLEEVQW